MYREGLTLFLCSVSYEKRIQTSVENTVNDLHYEIKFENCVKDKSNFLIKRNIAFLF